MSKMAAANLAVDAAVLAEWGRLTGAAPSAACDVLPLALAGERIALAGAPAHAASAGELWASLGAQAAAALTPAPAPLAPGAKPALLAPRPECRLWLVRGLAGEAPSAWVFVAFTPEGVHPKQKMLYASARDDLRRALPGAGERLGTDYHASEVAEVAEGAFAAWRRRDSSEAMSSRERQVADIGRTINAERAAMPVAAVSSMQRAAYALGAPLREALAGFKAAAAAAPAVRWLEVRLGSGSSGSGSGAAAGGGGGGGGGGGASAMGEVFELVASGAAGDAKTLTATVWQPAATEPRFFVTMPECSSASASSGGGAPAAAAAAAAAEEGAPAEGAAPAAAAAAAPSHPILLIYHCPEGAKPKARMLYSTAKTALQAALAAEGLVLSKTVREARAALSFPFFSLSPSLSHSLTHTHARTHARTRNARAFLAD
jgi:hypothetical protein